MLRHLVLLTWKAETPEEKIRELEEAFEKLPTKIDVIHDFEWGGEESPEGLARGFTHCYFISFKTREDRDEYLPHPEHQAFVEMVKPHLKDLLVADYWTE